MVFPANGTWLSTTEFGICITFIIICSTFVGLRLWARSLSRSFRLHVFTLSDVFVVIGYLAMLGNTACDLIEIVSGFSGRHINAVMDTRAIINRKITFVAAFFWITATCALKVSILFLYRELFPSRTLRMAIYVLVGLLGAFFIGFLVTILCQCFPTSLNWVKAEPGKCFNIVAETQAGAVINLIFDLMITILPISTIWRLQMPVRKRLAVIFIFALGSCADGVSVARAVTFGQWRSQLDYSYTNAKGSILSGMELMLGTIVACIPCIKPALTKTSTIIINFVSGSKTEMGRTTAVSHSNLKLLQFPGSRSKHPKRVNSTDASPNHDIEQQHRFCNNSREDTSVLQEFAEHEDLRTTTHATCGAVSSLGHPNDVNIISMRSDMGVYQTAPRNDELTRPSAVAQVASRT